MLKLDIAFKKWQHSSSPETIWLQNVAVVCNADALHMIASNIICNSRSWTAIYELIISAEETNKYGLRTQPTIELLSEKSIDMKVKDT